jgi:aminopeptidase
LDEDDPIAHWRRTEAEIKRIAAKLTRLKIEEVQVEGDDVDLRLRIGPDRRWLGGSGRNIPSFEVFTSPDWRSTEGWIRFNQPLYRYGTMVKGIELQFDKGRVIRATASENEALLLEMLATDEGASQVGEFSLTDKRLSRISKFMAQTLFDENIGGRYGNTHIAVGRAYVDAYITGTRNVSQITFKNAGFNRSSIHTDMISTADRIVTATLPDGSKKVIYKSGQFLI